MVVAISLLIVVILAPKEQAVVEATDPVVILKGNHSPEINWMTFPTSAAHPLHVWPRIDSDYLLWNGMLD